MNEAATETEVSIITPLYNSAPYVERTLSGLLAQTHTGWESILIDDGSTDDTARRVEPYLLGDTRFRYLSQQNQGIAGARNTGIRAARGAWVCLLDHDDLWLPTKLDAQLAFASAARLDIVGTDAMVVRGTSRTLYSEVFPLGLAADLKRAAAGEEVDVLALLIRGNFLCSSSVMLRTSLFESLGLLDVLAAPADDYEMWLRCAAAGARVGYLNEPLIEYHLHEHNYSRDQFRMVEKEIYALRKTARSPRLHRRYSAVLDQRISALCHATARAFLDEYHAVAAREGLAEALPFFKRALALAPSEVLKPRRLVAAFLRGARAGLSVGRRGA